MLRNNYDVETKVTDGVSFLFANVYGANIANKYHESRISHQPKALFLARRLCLRVYASSIILPLPHVYSKSDMQSIGPVRLGIWAIRLLYWITRKGVL